jgi:hypothetical protein
MNGKTALLQLIAAEHGAQYFANCLGFSRENASIGRNLYGPSVSSGFHCVRDRETSNAARQFKNCPPRS